MMRVHIFLLFALFGLSTASQCGNSCTCGNNACCSNAFTTYSPYSVFNIGNRLDQFSYGPKPGFTNQYRENRKKLSCLKVDPIPKSLREKYEQQPVYTRIIDYSEDNEDVDNICTTVFPLPDDLRTYVVYVSTVFSDGSNRIETTVGTDVGMGTYSEGNAYMSITQRVFASLGQNMYVTCTSQNFGESNTPTISVSTLGNLNPIPGACIQQIHDIIECASQSECGLHVLPYRYPTRCVTQQVCSLTNPLLFPTFSPYAVTQEEIMY